MATADQYANWIVNNESKKGTEQFNIVAKAYKEARAEEASGQISEPEPQPQEKGFIDNVGDKLSARGEKFGKDMYQAGDDFLSLNPATSLSGGMRGLRRLGGAVAGAGADIIGEGVSSLADTLIPDSVQDTAKDAMNYLGDTSVGQGAGSAVRSIAEIYKSFKEKSPELAQDLEDTANMTGFIGGAGLGKSAIQASSKVLTPIAAATKEVVKLPFDLAPQGSAKQKIAQLLLEDSGDTATATSKLKPRGKIAEYLKIGSQKIEGDSTAKSAITQGFDKGVVATVKAASPTDKKIMSKMVNVMEKIKSNAKFGMRNRPSDVVGDSLLKRFNIISRANKQAGRNIDIVAKSLKGQNVDIGDTVDNFIQKISNMGVSLGTDLKLNFRGSDIEGLTDVQNILNKVVRRMSDTRIPDAYDVHRLKKFIDEQVSYGKTTGGLSGKTQGVLKSLRANLDNNLDSNFERYNKVNSIYSETRGLLDDIQDIAGKKIDLTAESANKSMGQLLRGVMSNNKSRVKLLDSVDDIELMSKKYGGKFDDDIMTQILFADELDSVFKPVARTSFQGQIGQSGERAARAARAARSPADAALSAAGKGIDAVRGINEENAFKSIKNLLESK